MDQFEDRVSIYRRPAAGAWGLVESGVVARGQPTGASGVDQTDPGRTVRAQHFYRFASGTDLQAGDGVVVTDSWLASRIGKRLLADPPGDWGEMGGLQVILAETEEVFS